MYVYIIVFRLVPCPYALFPVAFRGHSPNGVRSVRPVFFGCIVDYGRPLWVGESLG